MRITAKLAYSQLKVNRNRSVWTLIGIILSAAMITAVFGFAASGDDMMMKYIGDNDYYLSMYNVTLYTIAAIFIAIIVSASVVVVSNAFRVSAGERTAQFGVLKSVGATKKQITQIIIYEGLFLCVIGIPIGIASGLAVHYTGIEIADYFLVALKKYDNSAKFALNFVLEWRAILLSVIVSFLTVFLSAWLPARKAAKIAAIDAIRGAGEITVKAGKIRANRLIGKVFGFEGTLAAKSMKRSVRNFRATFISLTISVTLFIAVGSFGEIMRRMTETYRPGIDVSVIAYFHSSTKSGYDEETDTYTFDYITIGDDELEKAAVKMRGYQNTTVFGAGGDFWSYSAYIPKNMMTAKMLEVYGGVYENGNNKEEFAFPITLTTVDTQNYAAICKKAGVPVGSNILVNRFEHYEDGGSKVFAPYKFNKQTLHVEGDYDGDKFDLPLHGVLNLEEIPSEVIYATTGAINVIVPELKTGATAYYWFANPADKDGFIEYAKKTMSEITVNGDFDMAQFSVEDVEAGVEAMLGISRLVMVFVYGFVIMLTLIGLTNVISTISVNVRSRSKEFAVLRSVGMTPGGLARMLNLESLMCSAKSLVFGVPIGIALSYLIYIGIVSPAEIKYNLPWLPILQCFIGVFTVTWIVMRYAARKLRGGSVVEAIRGE